VIPGILFLLAVPFLPLVIGLVLAARLHGRMRMLEDTVEEQARALDRLSTMVQALRKELAVVQPLEKPRVETPPVEAPRPAPPPLAAPRPEPTRSEPPRPEPLHPQPTRAELPRPERPRVPPPPSPPPPPPAPPKPVVRLDWEQLVGVKMFSAVAGIALVLAAVFFLRYSIEHGWLAPPVRVAIGLLAGIALLVACEMKAARKYPITANALDAAGVAILFATIFSAHALWQLIPPSAAFALLAMVTAVAVLLSIRRESLFIAILGLLGGFATPVLLSTGENRPVPLFTYLLLLNAGLAWVAARKGWTVLTVLTLVLTTLYQWGWVVRFLTASQLPLAMGIFIVFALAGFGTLAFGGGRRAGAEGRRTVERSGLAASLMPLLLSIYLAAIPAYGREAGLLFGFLFIVASGLLALTIVRRDGWPHRVGALGTVIVFAIWPATSLEPGDWRTLVGAAAAFVALYALAPIIARAVRRSLEDGGSAMYAAPILLFAFTVVAVSDPNAANPWRIFPVLFVLLALLAWRAVAEPAHPIYFVAAFFGVAAESAWSAVHLDSAHLGGGLLLYVAFAAFYLAVPLIARRIGHPLQPAWGGGAVLIAALCVLLFLAAGPRSAAAMWGMALLLAILNAGLFVESASGRLPVVSLVASALSWIVLLVWWSHAGAAVGVLPSLLVLVLLTLVMLAGHSWVHAREAADGVQRELPSGVYFGLLGHLFLFAVAANRGWTQPPWPLFGALAVMTMAVSAASLATGIGRLHAAGAIAAALVVQAWAREASGEWVAWMLVACEATAAYALAWMAAVRRGPAAGAAAVGSAVTLFVAEMTVVTASAYSDSLAAIAVSHVVNLSIILALCWISRWPWVAVAAVAPAWLGAMTWESGHPAVAAWKSALGLAVLLYGVFAAYPFVLGQRARASRDPYFAAVAASAFFFFTARAALDHGGAGRFSGAVPIAEGLVMAALLRQLLRVEPAESRDLGRLALVAGAALAFATVAIPLQLRQQWITIGWALEGLALAWAYRRIPHRGLFYWSVALLAIVFARLALNPAIFFYEPRGYRVFNWYLYTYLICGVAMLGAARLFAPTEDRLLPFLPHASAILPVGGVIVLFLLLNIEIADYYATGPEITFRFGVSLAQDLTYTLGWLVFGLGLLAACIYLRNRAGRIAAVAMIAVTTCKAFLYDLGSLGGLYRVVSLIGLAASLSLVALALQKYVLRESHGQ
jgi:uncharacterized membrane protein